jgi:hypothetical protein
VACTAELASLSQGGASGAAPAMALRPWPPAPLRRRRGQASPNRQRGQVLHEYGQLVEAPVIGFPGHLMGGRCAS